VNFPPVSSLAALIVMMVTYCFSGKSSMAPTSSICLAGSSEALSVYEISLMLSKNR